MKILVSSEGRFFYVRDLTKDFHCHYGIISKEDLSKNGAAIKTNTGKELHIFDSHFTDKFRKIKRGPQIIPIKDVSLIIAETGIGKDSIVVDAGAGSGALACMLGRVVKQVVSYEIRQDFLGIATNNITALGLENISLKNKNVYDGIDERDVDLVVLDVPEPWKGVSAAAEALKPGGFLVSYCPTTPQVSDFVKAIVESKRFAYVKTTEIIEREWEINERKVRPKSQAIGHSGFLTFTRKII